jgi:hypothetical protein
MLTLSSRFVKRYQVLKIMAITSAVCVLGPVAFSAARETKVTVRQIGPLDSVIADRILGQVNARPFPLQQASPMLLQGTTLAQLRPGHTQELKAAYQAGHTIVLLDATLEHIQALHGIIGEGVTYSSKAGEGVLAYTLRQEHNIPTATLLMNVQRSPLHPPSGAPDPTGLQDEELAFTRAADLTVRELRHLPQVSVPGPQDSNQPIAWQDNPLQMTTLAYNGPEGVYNTLVQVFALHSCSDNTDRYVVTALADWTATNAKFQSAATELGVTSMYYDEDNDVYVVANWMDDPNLTYCSSPSSGGDDADKCRYINYPLQYELQMIPPSTGTVRQVNATPAATQGQATTYQSGFTFSIGGTVNVSSGGPGGGISAGATWSNTTATTVPPLIVEVGNTGNQGVMWTFKYCTTGEEPDPGTNCTGHVQMVTDVCLSQLGDFSGTNPQQGQTPGGKFSNAVQSVQWEALPDTRVGSTFDIAVAFHASTVTTTANLWGAISVDTRDAGCDGINCNCHSNTTSAPVDLPWVFHLQFPSTLCLIEPQ